MKYIYNDIGVVVDEETGTFIKPESEHYRITVEELFEKEKIPPEKRKMVFQKDVGFLRSFRGNGVMLDKELTNAELSATIFISDFICYDDCVLRKNGNKNGHALSIKELSELRGVKYDTMRKTMYSLKNKEVIGFHNTGDGENETVWITVNPFIFCRGTKIEAWVINFYAKTKWATMLREHLGKTTEEATQDELVKQP